jgi:glycosyltransferase involved in cell wall biosynthesis
MNPTPALPSGGRVLKHDVPALHVGLLSGPSKKALFDEGHPTSTRLAENGDSFAEQIQALRQILSGARFIFLLSSLDLGGAERQAIHLARFLKQILNAEVEVWGYGVPGSAVNLCDRSAIGWRSIANPLQGNMLTKARGLTRFVQQLRQARPDVLMPYTMAPNILTALTWRLAGTRLCVWNQRDEGRGRVRRLVEQFAVRQVPLFISNSAHARDFLTVTLGADPGRVHVFRNGVTLTYSKVSREQWRRDHDIPADHFVACMLANLHHYKDHTTLLKAWCEVVGELSQRGTQATLLLAGRFDDMTEPLKNLADELHLGSRVRFLGYVSDIPSLLGAVDLGVFSSQREGCPNGVLECMAAGLAVVATDIPGICEALGGDNENVLSSPGNSGAMASRIIRLAVDESLRARYGSANRERVQRLFGVDRMCVETIALIARALQRS